MKLFGDKGKAIPLRAWKKVELAAGPELTLYGQQNQGYLRVTLVNNSRFPITIGDASVFMFSFKALDQSGEVVDIACPRQALTADVPPGSEHSQHIKIQIPQMREKSIAAIRVGLLKEGEFWVESINPQHAAMVRVSTKADLSPAEVKLAMAEQVWSRERSNGLRWPYGAMMVAQRQKLFYVPVAKCACTSLKSMMVQLAEIDNPQAAIELGVHLVTDRFNTGVQLKDKPIELAREILASDQYFKFSVIRDPFERLISAYLEKFVYKRYNQRNLLHTHPVIRAVQASEEIDLKRGISFDQFIEYILGQDPFELDPHWRPQHLYFKGVPHMSRIYRLDEMGALEQYLLEEQGVTITLGHENKTGRSDSPLPNASELFASELVDAGLIDPNSFLTSKHAKAIRQYYSEDFAFYHSAA